MEEKKRLQSNIASILAVSYMYNPFCLADFFSCGFYLFKGRAPSPEVGVVSEVLGVAQQSWAELWQSEKPRKITVRASSLAACGENTYRIQNFTYGGQLASPLVTRLHPPQYFTNSSPCMSIFLFHS